MTPTIRDDFKEMFAELADSRQLLYQLTLRDLKLRYKQSVMGFGWAVFMPLLNTVLFSVIFIKAVPLDTGVPYPVWAYCGLCTWNFFASRVKFATSSLAGNTHLITKVYFPREVLPVSAVLVCAVDFLVASSVLAVLMWWYGVVPGAWLLFVPVLLLVQLMLTTAISLVLAMANLFYRDVKYLVEALFSIWMFATSVVFPLDRVGGRLGEVLALNPLTPLIDSYRSVILFNQAPNFWALIYVSVASLVMLALSWLVFHRAEFKFAESV